MPKKPSVKKSKKKKSGVDRKAMTTALVVVLAAIVLGVCVMYCKPYFLKNKEVVKQTAVTQVMDESVTWLSEPQEIPMEKALFTPDWEDPAIYGGTDTPTPKAKYYKVGKDHDSDVLIAILPGIDPSGDRKIMLVHDQEKNDYRMVMAYSTTFYQGQYNGPSYSKEVSDDFLFTTYHALAAPEALPIAQGNLEKVSGKSSVFFFSNYISAESSPKGTLTEFAVTPWGTLYNYVIEGTNSEEIVSTRLQQFLLKLADGEVVSYQSHPQFVADDNVLLATWNDGSRNKDAFAWNSLGGCGAPGYVSILGRDEKKDLVQIGKTVSGEPLYGFLTLGNKTLKRYYGDLPEGKYYFYNQATGESSQIPITLEEYSQKRGVVVYEDSFGRLVAFVNQSYGSGAECGKPVIYLYPTKTTPVSVQVGAAVSVSEPEYGTGWNVTAHPDGTLVNADGKEYTSLFWEGLGHGQYPSVDAGFVVPQSKVKETLWSHTHKLGLNDMEAQEFMDFWMPHMPKTPYVRLTWFGTQQMNTLAPLTVAPKPDTSIRLFLDFAGLENNQQLTPQALSAPERTGFTLVEWGGLLRKGK